MENLPQPPTERKNATSGNRCGHSADRLRRLLVPSAWKPHHSRDATHAAIAQLFGRKVRRDGMRHARSEVREDAILVAQLLCRFLDFVRLVVQRDGRGVPIREIMQCTRLSRSRVNAGIRLLANKGFLRSWQPREVVDGKHRGRPAIRYFTREFLDALGVLKQINDNRKRKNLPPVRPSFVFSKLVADLAHRKDATSAHEWPPWPARDEKNEPS
jgi:hypothetical protein